nr:MAG: hypothetical protein [Metapenaeopsis lamellata majanivirus]
MVLSHDIDITKLYNYIDTLLYKIKKKPILINNDDVPTDHFYEYCNECISKFISALILQLGLNEKNWNLIIQPSLFKSAIVNYLDSIHLCLMQKNITEKKYQYDDCNLSLKNKAKIDIVKNMSRIKGVILEIDDLNKRQKYSRDAYYFFQDILYKLLKCNCKIKRKYSYMDNIKGTFLCLKLCEHIDNCPLNMNNKDIINRNIDIKLSIIEPNILENITLYNKSKLNNMIFVCKTTVYRNIKYNNSLDLCISNYKHTIDLKRYNDGHYITQWRVSCITCLIPIISHFFKKSYAGNEKNTTILILGPFVSKENYHRMKRMISNYNIIKYNTGSRQMFKENIFSYENKNTINDIIKKNSIIQYMINEKVCSLIYIIRNRYQTINKFITNDENLDVNELPSIINALSSLVQYIEIKNILDNSLFLYIDIKSTLNNIAVKIVK